jgi:prevent-host-death family protein
METVNATEFKAKCLDLLDQVGSRQIGQLGITKHGRIVAVLVPPASSEDAVRQLHGFLRGSVFVPEGVDLTAPVLDEALDAEEGNLHA